MRGPGKLTPHVPLRAVGRRLVAVWAVGAVLWGTGGCAAPDGPVLVGVAEGTGGPGQAELHDVALRAAADVNREGGIRGRPLELRFVDHGLNDAAASISAARTLVANDSIVAAVGHANSLSTAAAESVYRERMPLVSPALATDGSQTPAWVFRLDAGPDAYGRRLAAEVEDRTDGPVAVLFDNTPVARAEAAALRDALTQPPVLLEPIYVEDRVGSHEPIVELVARRGVGAVVLITGARNTGRLLSLLDRRLPGLPVFVITETGADQGGSLNVWLLAAAVPGDAADGGPPPPDSVRTAFMYDAIRLVARAAEEAGPGREDIAAWLRELDGDHFVGRTGPVSFDAVGGREGLALRAHRICADPAPPRAAACGGGGP